MEAAEVETTETKLDLPTESPGKMITSKLLETFNLYFLIEKDVLITDSVVERRFTAETELDLPTDSLGKIVHII